jgi:hypothetical protein
MANRLPDPMGNFVMKHRSLIVPGLALLLVTAMCQAQSIRRWDFDRIGDLQGWTIPAEARGVVMGGSLWITLTSKEKDPAHIASTEFQITAAFEHGSAAKKTDPAKESIASPDRLGIPAVQIQKLRLRVLNLSPVTDFFVLWKTKENGWGEQKPEAAVEIAQRRRCTMQADIKDWQEVTCHIDDHWRGTIEQIAIQIPMNYIRGDLWFNWIEIASGTVQTPLPKPDIAGPDVTPKVGIPGISQSAFADAFKVLQECVITDVPIYGFTYPVMAPGGYYGEGWWVLDSSLTLVGAQWTNRAFAENVMRGFRDVQAGNPDGHIDPHSFAPIRGQVGDVSQLPRIFEVAYDIARRSNDVKLRGDIYELMRRYLDWWLSPAKQDARTGLISGILEETFGEQDQSMEGIWIAPQSVAPVDLNVAVALGAKFTSELAASLGKKEDAQRYGRAFTGLTGAINRYLWNDEDGAYYNYDLRDRQTRRRLIVTTFDPLRLGIASPLQRDRLLKMLLDPSKFNWGRLPLTSVAMSDPNYIEARGQYDGRAWWGDIWTLRNMIVVAGLEDSARPELAAELNWSTIKAFNGNYHEFLIPSTGEGQGVERYGWSASQYIGAIVEHLFGIDFDSIEHRARIIPHIPRELYGQDIALESLILPTDKSSRLSIHIKQSSATAATIRIDIKGNLPRGSVLIKLPGIAKEKRVPMRRSFTATFQ